MIADYSRQALLRDKGLPEKDVVDLLVDLAGLENILLRAFGVAMPQPRYAASVERGGESRRSPDRRAEIALRQAQLAHAQINEAAAVQNACLIGREPQRHIAIRQTLPEFSTKRPARPAAGVPHPWIGWRDPDRGIELRDRFGIFALSTERFAIAGVVLRISGIEAHRPLE